MEKYIDNLNDNKIMDYIENGKNWLINEMNGGKTFSSEKMARLYSDNIISFINNTEATKH